MMIGATKNWRRLAFALTGIVLAVATIVGVNRVFVPRAKSSETSGASKVDPSRFKPSEAVWASLSIEQVSERIFRAEHVTEGKISVNEDSSTPIFSPYTGRVTKLLVKPSDVVERGQSLFIIEATDTVQALNDFVAALWAQ
jgi:cobalt-zinc-cadmium efflux system membrane fusion protein